MNPKPDVLGYRRHDRCDMPVECDPEIEELVPVSVLIPLQLDPSLLIVAGEDEIVLPGRANKSLMVVARGVDEVADDLAW